MLPECRYRFPTPLHPRSPVRLPSASPTSFESPGEKRLPARGCEIGAFSRYPMVRRRICGTRGGRTNRRRSESSGICSCAQPFAQFLVFVRRTAEFAPQHHEYPPKIIGADSVHLPPTAIHVVVHRARPDPPREPGGQQESAQTPLLGDFG